MLRLNRLHCIGITVTAILAAPNIYGQVTTKSPQSDSASTPNKDTLAQKNLDDVVVVGYGKQNRAALTSSITTVKAENLNQGAITDVGQMLQGKVPGLNITASGNPNKASAIILRGASTLNSSQTPFYVIDGMPGADISIVAPSDIASIEVLKDAAATAIYGNRAASGVIMVTTKRGAKGAPLIAYNGYAGIEKVSKNIKVMNASQLTSFLVKNNLNFSSDDNLGANTDWQKEIERKQAISHNHNFLYSSGNENGDYTVSLNYLKKEGIIRNSDLEKAVARIAINQNLFDNNLKLHLGITNSVANANDVPYLNTILLQAAKYLPVSPVKNTDGTYFENFNYTNYYNPVAMLENSTQATKTNTLVANLGIEIKLPFGFHYNSNLVYQNVNAKLNTYFNSYYTNKYSGMYDNPDPSAGYHTVQTFGTNGQATRSTRTDESKIWESYLTWDKTAGLHKFNAVVGYAWNGYSVGEGFQVTTANFPGDATTYNNLALSNPSALSSFKVFFGDDGASYKYKLISDFARFNYSFNNKYMLQASIRRDGSSVFGDAHRWGYFPSVGLAWRIINESFMEKQNFFNDLKMRVSYGVTGNSSGFNAYSTKILMGTIGTFYYNGSWLNGYGSLTSANKDLHWEKTGMADIGFDFAIKHSILSGSIDVYDKKTNGMIFTYAVSPLLVPAGYIVANGGSMSNKGVELVLNAQLLNKTDFSWNTSINLAHNTNKITSLSNSNFYGGDSTAVGYPEGSGNSGNSIELLKQGKPLGQFYTLQYNGKNSSGVSQFVSQDGSSTTDPSYGTDYHYLGNAQPKLLLGWNNSFKYKQWDMSFFIRGTIGNKIMNATRADLFNASLAQYNNISVDAANESVTDYNANKYSSRFIENGTYFRFDNATLGYNIKSSARYFKSARVYFTANNLFVITKYNGVDPEINQGGIAPGIDYNNFYPKTRTFMLGLNISLQ